MHQRRDYSVKTPSGRILLLKFDLAGHNILPGALIITCPGRKHMWTHEDLLTPDMLVLL
jgi:hypothetical protein